MSGLFSTLNVGVRGLTAQQGAIDVTSHNIANANTDGYSRQRVTMETTRPSNTSPGQMGTGVQISSIIRIRDTYLDYQIRAENGTMGLNEGKENVLSQVETVFNGLSDTGVATLIDKVYASWQTLATSPQLSNTRTVVAQQSKALTDQLNSIYNQLKTVKDDCKAVIKQDVVDINSMLSQIDKLNQQIKEVKIGGDEPNDLLDKRDLLEDKLSAKFGITIDKKTYGGVDLKATDGATGDLTLVKSESTDDVKRFSYVSSITQKIAPVKDAAGVVTSNGTYDVTYYKNGDMSSDNNKVTMTMELSNSAYTSLDQGRVLVADKNGYAVDSTGNRIAGMEFSSGGTVGTKVLLATGTGDATGTAYQLFNPTTGELKGYMDVQVDIDKYVNQLNNLAKGIAFSVNAIHSGTSKASDAGTDTNVLNFFVNSAKPTADGEAEITAGNITVNSLIINDPMLIKVGTGNPPGPTDGTRAAAIAKLKDVKLKIQGVTPNSTRSDFLSGVSVDGDNTKLLTISSAADGMTIGSYFTTIVNGLAIDVQGARKNVTNHTVQLSKLEESRTSISGVSLDEEMANLVQYQHAYAANAKIISTVDELLDLIVNGLKK
ncbi:flagellar hook-associated protein FlgK [Clostridium estertheticum]|uniref:flagellar hook-associated protein FlgK n=1 Tax=Clostridium estertheticum TaxID=238834 RepID=UPI001C6F27CF|nr:flagellar hook-associated protein FlgK [Clostridium estertheticum]MBW9151963.1 flagellar hook-associated protein FlgK [Clostridium estertheticum]WLC85300.1 flagellar hook-associated protein FlgK [Clostridium estertheticum]